MKKILFTILTISLLVSCGNKEEKQFNTVLSKGSLEELRAKKAEIQEKVDALNTKIETINSKIAEKSDVEEKSILVTTFKAKDTIFKHYLELQANVQTNQNIVITAEFSGMLVDIFVSEGQNVTKGQKLAKIEDGGLSQQLAQLEIQAQLAQTTYERQKRLWDQEIGSEIQFLQAKSNYEAQEKAIAQLQEQIEKTVIKAPFSGFVDDIITDKGTIVAPGAQIIRLVNLSEMYLEADVPESYIGSITQGTLAKVNIPVLHEELTTEVALASNYINPGNRSFRIKIDVPNEKGLIKPNLTAKAKINDYTNEKAIQVPVSILSENANGDQYVYLAKKENGELVAKRAIVTTGRTENGKIEILTGITAGDQVLLEGARSVKDGQKITIQ